MDLGAVAHIAAIQGRIPFLHFFDGFRTSHEIQKIEVWDEASLQEMMPVEAVDAFRKRALNPEHPAQHKTLTYFSKYGRRQTDIMTDCRKSSKIR